MALSLLISIWSLFTLSYLENPFFYRTLKAELELISVSKYDRLYAPMRCHLVMKTWTTETPCLEMKVRCSNA